MSGYQKNPDKFLARHFKLHGGEIERKENRGALWRFPDGRLYFIPRQLSVKTAQAWVSCIKTDYPYVQRGRAPHELPRRSGRAPVLDLDNRHLSASTHAKERFALMGQQGGLTWEEIDLALRAPIRVTYAERHESWVWVGERVAVALYEKPGGYVISTLLWSSNQLFEQYPRPEGRPHD